MITSALHAELESDGFVVTELLDARDAEALRECFVQLRRSEVPMTRQVLYTHAAPPEARPSFEHLLTQWFNPHQRAGAGSTTAILARTAQRLSSLGFELAPFQDALLSKTAAHAHLPWHQDESYWPFDAPEGLVVWCALDAADHDNGGLELARGSHRLGRGPAIDLHTGGAQSGVVGELPDRAAFVAACPTLRPGDAVLFRPRTWHRSGRNATGAPRRGWSSSWLPPGVRLRAELAPRHPLARVGEVVAR